MRKLPMFWGNYWKVAICLIKLRVKKGKLLLPLLHVLRALTLTLSIKIPENDIPDDTQR